MRTLMRNLGRDQQSHDCCFTKGFTRFQPMESVDQNKAAFVGPNLNGSLLSNFQNAFRDLLDDLGFKRLPPLHGNVNPVDWESFRLEHSLHSVAMQPNAPTATALRIGTCTRGTKGSVGALNFAKEATTRTKQHSIACCKISKPEGMMMVNVCNWIVMLAIRQVFHQGTEPNR